MISTWEHADSHRGGIPLLDALQRLPPWGDREWLERMADSANGLFRNYAKLAPQIAEFDSAPD